MIKMYKPAYYSQMLIWTGDTPDLESTDRFWTVIKSLPKGHSVPMPIVKLGLMTEQLQPVDSDVDVQFSVEDIHSASTATVPPGTLKAVRQLLLDLIPELDDDTKSIVGEFCEITGLNRPPDKGASFVDVRKKVPDKHDPPGFFAIETASTDTNQDSSNKPKKTTTPTSTTENCTASDDDPFASGKEVTKEGGERITGKNPFADVDRLKDAGLHQGGGN